MTKKRNMTQSALNKTDAIHGLGAMFETIKTDLYKRYGKKTTLTIWETIEEKANDFSNMLTFCRCKYLENMAAHPELGETLSLFEKAACVVALELFAVSAMATFFVDAESRHPKTAAELREMFAAACWGKGVSAFNDMGKQIFGSTEATE